MKPLNRCPVIHKEKKCTDCRYFSRTQSGFAWCNLDGEDIPAESWDDFCVGFEENIG